MRDVSTSITGLVALPFYPHVEHNECRGVRQTEAGRHSRQEHPHRPDVREGRILAEVAAVRRPRSQTPARRRAHRYVSDRRTLDCHDSVRAVEI
jgi:hypothetical protein